MIDSNVRRAIALARFPRLIRDAVRDFQQLTGLTVVTTLGSASPIMQTLSLPSPPVHPLCAMLLQGISRRGPCDAEWQEHLQSAAKMMGTRVHTCPLGLQCAGVPIVLGEELLGMAKLVSGQEISEERFRSFVRLLEAFIAQPCQELHIQLLRGEIDTLHRSVARLRRVRRAGWPGENHANGLSINHENDDGSRKAQTLVSQILAYLDEHYVDRTLSLSRVAGAVGKNEKYVAHLFVRQVGMHMRTYIITLRLRRACELLLQTNLTVDDVAHDSGFAHPVQFRQSFHRAIGVTASVYRQIFTAGEPSGNGGPDRVPAKLP